MNSAHDYYPFGMYMPGRSYADTTPKFLQWFHQILDTIWDKDHYRYGYNGKYKDNEWAGPGNHYDYGARSYDPRIGRFISVDPLNVHFPRLTPYQLASNRCIDGIDLDGLEYATYRITINKKTRTVLHISPPVLDYELKNNGTKGPGIQYDIYGENAEPLETKFIENYYGIYLGPNNPQLPEEGKSIDRRWDDIYALAPINEIDGIAKRHDLDFRDIGLHGLTGVLDDKSSLANLDYIDRANNLLVKYHQGGIDAVTGKKITSEAATAAKWSVIGFKYAEESKEHDNPKYHSRISSEKKMRGQAHGGNRESHDNFTEGTYNASRNASSDNNIKSEAAKDQRP